MLVLILRVAITWGVYGLIAGLFMGSDSCLKWLGYVMTICYIVICIGALFQLDWTLAIGIPCFIAGTGVGRKVTGAANSSPPNN
jgi:hypothetical protein